MYDVRSQGDQRYCMINVGKKLGRPRPSVWPPVSLWGQTYLTRVLASYHLSVYLTGRHRTDVGRTDGRTANPWTGGQPTKAGYEEKELLPIVQLMVCASQRALLIEAFNVCT